MEISQLLGEKGQKLVNDIQRNLAAAGKNATGETARSLKFSIEQNGSVTRFVLTGRPFFNVVQTGRRPTPDKKPSREMITRITAWVKAKNIDLSAVWGIATKIQQEGTKLWQEGGRTDIINPAVDEFINSAARDILANEAEEFKIKIRDMKWQ